MEQPHKQIEYRGYLINIHYDEDPESPREWDNLGTFYTSHPNYLPEKNFRDYFDRGDVFDEDGNFTDSFEKKYIALKIYLYDHSGLTICSGPFSCRWDSGLFGMVAVSIEKVKKEYGWKVLTKSRRRKVEEQLQAEIDTYDQYLRGEVYGFRICPADDDSQIIDSCWGYFGDGGLADIEGQCRDVIDDHIAREQQAAAEQRIYQLGPELPFPEFVLSTL